MIATVSRTAHFNAAHRLFKPEWSDLKNAEIFGKCSNPNYHGHNYEIIVSVTGEIDKETGFVMDLKVLKAIIENEVEIQLDHKNLNVEVDYFKSVNPTAENIAVYIYNTIKPQLSPKLQLEIKLFETPRNSVTYSGK